MALFVRMIIIAVNMTLHNNIFHSNSYIILICVMCLWPGLVKVLDQHTTYRGTAISDFLCLSLSHNLLKLGIKKTQSKNDLT
jgi:hypothetical protein